ncbi:unnamed protein product [Euphydryas editha]|uniref:Endonuclease/exonuclease/phosphatase domain-containing protein n=1 Tax=Euphydryas editha TaxID=104508 RepID=A0AAU9TGL6_EUPED|nr:unnamed protein product [Euphydryas editha]
MRSSLGASAGTLVGRVRVSGRSGIREEGTIKVAIIVFNVDLHVTQYPKLNLPFFGNKFTHPAVQRRVRLELRARKWKADCNAKSVWWGSPVTDRRGEKLHGTLEDLGLVILNKGETLTFDVIRGEKRFSSYVDITTASPHLLDLVDD